MMLRVDRMFTLKQYQKNTIEVLTRYLADARFSDPKSAYDNILKDLYGEGIFKPFKSLDGLEDVPYVCLRLPTGGGKTLLSAHTIRLAGENYLDSDYSLTLWLVLTDSIKQQTLETLTKEDHPNRQVLNQAFNGNFRVFDIADFKQIRPLGIDNKACIIVSTFQSLRVDDTNGRKVYAHNENLEPHFSKITATDSMEFVEESNQLKYSLANLLNWYRPLVIIDEAHNAKSNLSMEVLKRVNAAIQSRQKLEELANNKKLEHKHIRPIVLFQAENKDREITVEVLKKHLIENENIDESEIAIATGTQKELDGLDLCGRRQSTTGLPVGE